LDVGKLEDGTTHMVSSTSSQSRIVVYRAGTHEHDTPWAPRPVPEEVYDHLQEFFPHHDLDKAVIEVGHVESIMEPTALEDRRRQVKKSIRMVAEEQINRNLTGMQRRTKLWDTNVEELLM